MSGIACAISKRPAHFTPVSWASRAPLRLLTAVFYRVNDEQYLEFSPGLGAQDDVRLTHVALTTTDIQALRRRLQSHGARAGLGNHSEAPIVE
jgi:hypothetical protein